MEPPASQWVFPEVQHAPSDLVAVGADLEPGTILAAYRAGCFPMPHRRQLGWWSPVMRGILPLNGLHISRSLRKSQAKFRCTFNSAFEAVVSACASQRRPGGWITKEIQTAYGVLHTLGWAHSVEVWEEDELIGGLYGVGIGGLFAGESMFHTKTDASKVALIALVEQLSDEYAPQRVLDVQWNTPHLARLGVIEIPRQEYLARLSRALLISHPIW